jgi:hypothetical protein
LLEIARDVGSYAGLVAFAGLALLIFLQFTQARDIRRLREWAGSAPERDATAKEETSALAASRAQELREIEEARQAEQKATTQRDVRRERREAGLPELTRTERMRAALPEPRYIALILAAVIILGAGVAYAATHFLGSEGDKHGRTARTTSSLQPKNIKVSVLNGTAVSGLAGRYGDKLDRLGYTLDAVTNTPSSFAKSVVMFRRGRGPEARQVSRAVAIPKLRLMTKEIATSAASAEVAVVVGEDRASS